MHRLASRSARRLPALLATAAASAFAFGAVAPAAHATTPPAVCTASPALGAAQGWTEFVAGDGQRGSESEGSIAYGGSLNASGMTVGTRLTAPTTTTDTPTLVVGGTANSFNLQRGSAYVRNLTGYINFNGGGRRLANPPLDVAGAFPDLRARSTAWATAPANGEPARVIESGTEGTIALGGQVLLLRGANAQRNVFTVTPAQLRNIRATLIDVPAGSTTLINVSGTAVQIDGETRYRVGNDYRQADDAPVNDAVRRTVWNLPTAETVTLNSGSAFGGTVFAPKAAVGALSIGHSNGQIIAASFRSNFETHQYLVPDNACLPPVTTPTPDPDPEPEPVGTAELHVAKTVDRDTVLGGEQVTFTLTVANRGTAVAADVVLSDLLPAGLTLVSADPGCTVTGQVVRCVAGSVPAGASRSFRVVAATSVLLAPSGGDDQFSANKVEKQLTLQADQVVTEQLACPAGGTLTDAAVRVDHVDQGTGTLEDVELLRLNTLADGRYEAVVANHSRGQAQAKLFGVCLPPATTGGHALLVGDPVTKTATLGVGRHTATFDCGTGRTPVAPSLDVPHGRARIVASVPVGEGGRRIVLQVDEAGSEVTVGVRCLAQLTGDANGTTTALRWNTISKPITVGAGQVATESLICGDQQKGFVAGYELDGGLVSLGNDPQPKSRVFRIHNPTGAPLSGTLYLLCIDERTTNPQGVSSVVNTVTGSSSSPQSTGAVLSASVGVRIQGAAPPSGTPSVDIDAPPVALPPAARSIVPVPEAAPVERSAARSATLRSSTVDVAVRCANAACSGTVEVRAAKRLRVGGRTIKAKGLLAQRSFRVTRGRNGTVRVVLPKRVAAALRAQKVRSVRVTVRDGSGRRTTTVLRLGRR